jgi:erythromycin esterase-like protein
MMKLLALSLLLSSTAWSQIPGVVAYPHADPAQLTDAQLSQTLDRTIARAPIVAIGESVHGSSGFLRMEQRLTRYLVERKGFRTIILENPVIRSRGLTAWVRQCRSGAAAALPIDLLYMPVEDDRAFFAWMCDWNRAHCEDPVVFRGMDIWDRPWEHQVEIARLVSELKLPYAEETQSAHDHCWMHNQSDWSKYQEYVEYLKVHHHIPPADHEPCTTSLRRIRKGAWEQVASARPERRFQLFTLIQSLDTALGYQGYLNYNEDSFGTAWDQRDRAQAKNEHSIFVQEGLKRAVLISHTSHTAKMESASDWWGTGLGAFHSGVSFLRQVLPVATIGLTGYQVSGTQGVFTLPTSSESLDKTLHDRGFSFAFVDPRSSFVLARDRWWVENENNADSYPDGVKMIPKDNFDAFYFLDQTLVGQAVLPWRPIWQW